MSAREEFDAIVKAQKNLNRREDEVRKKQLEMKDQVNKALAKLIKEENLLSGLVWRLAISSPKRFKIYAYSNDSPGSDLLLKIASGGWHHFTLELSDGDGQLRFDDNCFSINFTDSTKMIKFMSDYGITPNLDNFDKRQEELNAELQRILSVRSMLGI